MNVVCYEERYKKSVIAELETLLAQARSGELIGIGYVSITSTRSVRASLAGILAKDRLKAAGVLLSAAMRAADAMEE